MGLSNTPDNNLYVSTTQRITPNKLSSPSFILTAQLGYSNIL